MRVALAALLLFAPACDVVFGLERPTTDASSDAPPELVTGRYRYRYAALTGAGTAVYEMPHPDVILDVQFGDEEPSRVELDATGAFSFMRPAGAAYRLTSFSMLDGGVPVETHHDAAHLELITRSAGRPTRTPVTQPTTLTFQQHAITGTRIVLSTGLWTETAFVGDSFDWAAARSASGTLGLLDAQVGDRLWYIVRQVFMDGTTPYTAYAADANVAVTIVDGSAQSLPLTPVTHTRDRCAKVVARRAAVAQRVVAAAGAGAGVVGADWIVSSVPSVELGPVGTLTMTYAGEVNAPTDTSVTAMYRDPFGLETVVSLGAAVVRDIAYPGAIPMQVSIAERVFIPFAPCPATNMLEATQGFPGTLSLNDIQLTAPDGKSVALVPGERPVLSWTLSTAGRVDLNTAVVYEVIADAGKTKIVPVRAFRTVGRSITLDPQAMIAGHYYAIRLDSGAGLPDAATGDLATQTYPMSNALQWSHVFQVTQ